MSDTLVEIRDLKKHFPVMKGVIFQKPIGWVKAVDGVSYTHWHWGDARLGGRVGMWQDHDVEADLDVGEADEWRHHLSRPGHSNARRRMS